MADGRLQLTIRWGEPGQFSSKLNGQLHPHHQHMPVFSSAPVHFAQATTATSIAQDASAYDAIAALSQLRTVR